MNKTLTIIIIAMLWGAIAGAITANLILKYENSENALIKKFYLTENAVHISPHSLRLRMDKNTDDYILVDVRSKEEYEKEHIIGAINIPVYKDKKTPAYEDIERIINEFSGLPKDKEIIVYCYSTACMSGRKTGKLLAENNIYVKQLGIGWNEWRYFWNLWNHEYEWEITNVNDYIYQGKEPGIPKLNANSTSCSLGSIGC